MRNNRAANNHVADLQQSARVLALPERDVALTALGHCALTKGAPQTVAYLRLKAIGLTHQNAFALASAGYDVEFVRVDSLLALFGDAL